MSVLAPTAPQVSRAGWRIPALLAVGAVVVRVGAFRAPRALTYDESTYGTSVVDMRHGLAPYSGVFSSQGPLHLPLLRLGDLIGFGTIDAPRVTPVLAGVTVTIAGWAIARRLGADQTVAIVTACLLATTGSMLWTTGAITGDGPAAAFTALAVWSALVYRDRPSLMHAVLTGIAVGAALATKPLVFAVVIPVAWWLVSRRKPRDLVAAAVGTAAVWFAAALPFGLGPVWDQSIAYHTGPGITFSARYQFGKVVSLLALRDTILLAAVALGIVAAIVGTRRQPSSQRRTDTIVVAVWAITVGFVLVFEKAMYANHLATLVLPLAFLFALNPPPLRWLAIALIALVPFSLASLNDILWPRAYTGIDAQAVAALHALPPGTRAISDDPGLVWRAGLSTPAQMNDLTIIRTYQHMISADIVARAARGAGTCAVLIWTFRFDDRLHGLRTDLAAVGYEPATVWQHGKELWLRPPCRRGAA